MEVIHTEFFIGDVCKPRRPSAEVVEFLDNGYQLSGVFHRIPKDMWDLELTITEKKYICKHPKRKTPVFAYTTVDKYSVSRVCPGSSLVLAEPRQSEHNLISFSIDGIVELFK